MSAKKKEVYLSLLGGFFFIRKSVGGERQALIRIFASQYL